MYSLVGVDGNAFSIMAYVRKALRETGHSDMAEGMMFECMSGDYNHLLITAMKYIDIANGEE